MPLSGPLKAYVAYATLAVIGLAGSILLFDRMRCGAGISTDSVIYVSAARNLLVGHGFSVFTGNGQTAPMTSFPPFFSMLLALAGAVMRTDPLIAARWCNAFLFGANIVIAGLSVHAYTRSLWASLAGASFMLVSFDMIAVHSMAWSEPVFMACGFAGLLLVTGYLSNGNKACLYTSAAFTALAFLSRYAGLSFVLSGAIVLFFMSARTLKARSIETACWCGVSCLPIGVWIARNIFLVHAATNRNAGFHPPLSLGNLYRAVNVMSAWCMLMNTAPAVKFLAVLAVIAVVSIGAVAVASRRAGFGGGAYPDVPKALSVFIAAYLAVLVLSICFFDADILLDNRMLSPVYMAAVIVIVSRVYDIAGLFKYAKLVWAVPLVLYAALMRFILPYDTLLFVKYRAEGKGYASERWAASETIRLIKEMPPQLCIYTNLADAVYIMTGKNAYAIPPKAIAKNRAPNKALAGQMQDMIKRIAEHGGVIVYFRNTDRKWYQLTEAELCKALRLEVFAEASDGVIYRLPRGLTDGR